MSCFHEMSWDWESVRIRACGSVFIYGYKLGNGSCSSPRRSNNAASTNAAATTTTTTATITTTTNTVVRILLRLWTYPEAGCKTKKGECDDLVFHLFFALPMTSHESLRVIPCTLGLCGN